MRVLTVAHDVDRQVLRHGLILEECIHDELSSFVVADRHCPANKVVTPSKVPKKELGRLQGMQSGECSKTGLCARFFSENDIYCLQSDPNNPKGLGKLHN